MTSSINDLPEEVLIEVLKCLDTKSVKEASLVCTDWNRLVSTSPAVMRKFLLKIDHRSLNLENSENFEGLLTVRSNFVSMKVVFATESIKERMVNVVQHFGKKLLELELREVKMKESDMVLWLLQHTPQLVVLHLNIWKSKEESGSDQPAFESIPVELRSLRKIISTEHANWKIFDCLLVPRLTQLECHGGDDEFEPKNFYNFLQTLPNLKSLMLDFKHISKMDSAFPFKLEKLSCSTFDCDFGEKLRIFLTLQSSSIQELAAASENAEFFEFVFTKLPKITKFSSNFSLLPTSRDFYFKLKPMPWLRELEISKFSCDIGMEGVLGNCPELTKLSAVTDQDLPNRLEFIACHNPKLESLSIYKVQTTEARFEFLKTLEVCKVDDEDSLVEFLTNNSTTETLVVSSQRENFGDDLLDFLMNKTNIRHVIIHGRSIFDVFEKIKFGYGNWKTLDLGYRDGRLDSPCSARFIFPANSDDWNPHEDLESYFK